MRSLFEILVGLFLFIYAESDLTKVVVHYIGFISYHKCQSVAS